MKQKDILALVVIGIVATVFSSIIASKIFSSSSQHKLKAPTVQAIDSSFPDIKNDTAYKGVFNNNALDPSQLIQIGTNQNLSSFNGQ
jgi:hypothetical protein